jgi:glycosyltransferase involved in cell wall biosynthesis
MGSDHRIRVLFVAPSYSPFLGGAQNFQQAMARRLVANGHHVTVVTTNARIPDDFWQPPQDKGRASVLIESVDHVPVHRVSIAYPAPAPYAFGVLRRLSYLIHRTWLPWDLKRAILVKIARFLPPLPELESTLARLLPDVDLVQAIDSSWDGLFIKAEEAAQAFGKPFVAIPLMHLGDKKIAAQFQMPHQLEVYGRADAVIALSHREASEYQALGVPPEHIHVISMGIDPEPLPAPSAEDVAKFRGHYTEKGSIVAFVGANTFDKGAFTLAEAVAVANLQSHECHLICAGAQAEGLRSHVESMNTNLKSALDGRLHILGRVDEATKQTLLAACDVLALPSRVDTFGIVLLEAWLHGKPVIGADAGGISELIRPGETGFLVPFGDAHALAAALGEILHDRDRARQLGLNGRDVVLKKFTWEHTYRRLWQIYRDLVPNVEG